jgi:hypothetical protein
MQLQASRRNLRNRLVLPALVLFSSLLIAGEVFALCTTSCVDVNACGPPDAGCVYSSCVSMDGSWILSTLGCCDQDKTQHKLKKFFDCSAPPDGNADCELRQCFTRTAPGLCSTWGNPVCP